MCFTNGRRVHCHRKGKACASFTEGWPPSTPHIGSPSSGYISKCAQLQQTDSDRVQANIDITMRFYFFAPLDSNVGGPISLGSIIEAPRFADQPLNESPIPIDDSKILKPPARTDYHLKTGRTVGGNIGLWAEFLGPILGASGNASFDAKKTEEKDVSCDLLETRWFRPTLDYIKESIADPEVKNWLTQNRAWFGHTKIFMITGIKIAHNASFAYKVIKEKGTNFHFGLDGTNSGVPVKAGPEANLRDDNSRDESFKIVEPFVMAYRMNEIKIKSGEVSSNKPFTDGAALGTVTGAEGEKVELFFEIVERDANADDIVHGPVKNLEDEEGEVCGFAHS